MPQESNKSITTDHNAIRAILNLDKPLRQRDAIPQDLPQRGLRPWIILLISLCVVAASIAAWIGFCALSEKQEENLAIAKRQQAIQEEEARRNRIEYADIAFLDSIPPQVAIAMNGKPLYAPSKDGAYSELRARESTWIRNLPVKEDSIFKFQFSAEGFKTLERSVAYYDWFPSRTPNGNPLQKAFKKIVLEPDNSPRSPMCENLPEIAGENPCSWSIVREIAFRERYAQAISTLSPSSDDTRKALLQLFEVHPALLNAAPGFSPQTLAAQSHPAPNAPDATKALIRNLQANPYALYGTIRIETDTPNTKIFFMREPLMTIKSSGSMAQVTVSPDAPYEFATYGQGRPIIITEKMSVRLEAPNAPPYVAEILPIQWHCNIPNDPKILQWRAPNFPAPSPDFRHYLCDYTLTISAKFAEFKQENSIPM